MKFHSLLILECVMLLLSSFHTKCSHGARILGFFGTASRSHFIVQEPVMKELAKRGHNVTVVTSYKQSGEPLSNYRHIEISDFLNDPFLSSFASDALQSADKSPSATKAITFFNKMVGYSIKMMRHAKFLPLKGENFDLVVIGWFMNEYALGLSAHFHCPSVIISPNINFYPIRRFSGNPSSVSTIPSAVFGTNPRMAFVDRVFNLFAYIVEFLMFEFTHHFYSMPYYNEEFPPDKYPAYEEVLKNVSLVLLAQHFTGHVPEALLPNVIEVEGMHVKGASPLPMEIKQFLDDATDGAIFFSLGSNIQSSDLNNEIVSTILNKFRSLKQKVLWKFETQLPNMPDNVKIGKWFPQNDILAHPNVKLFISHCGKGGITEAKYHGVPIFAIPIFGDQFSNADIIMNEGWSVRLPLRDLNAVTFSTVLDEVLTNATYLQTAKKQSTLYKDRPEHPLDRAVFWIEYVIRHNGAFAHLQSPAVHLNLLQFYSVDVFAFILLVVYVIVKWARIMFNVFLIKVFGIRRSKAKEE